MSLYALRQMKRNGASREEMEDAGDLCYMEIQDRRYEEEKERALVEAAEREAKCKS